MLLLESVLIGGKLGMKSGDDEGREGVFLLGVLGLGL